MKKTFLKGNYFSAVLLIILLITSHNVHAGKLLTLTPSPVNSAKLLKVNTSNTSTKSNGSISTNNDSLLFRTQLIESKLREKEAALKDHISLLGKLRQYQETTLKCNTLEIDFAAAETLYEDLIDTSVKLNYLNTFFTSETAPTPEAYEYHMRDIQDEVDRAISYLNEHTYELKKSVVRLKTKLANLNGTSDRSVEEALAELHKLRLQEMFRKMQKSHAKFTNKMLVFSIEQQMDISLLRSIAAGKERTEYCEREVEENTDSNNDLEEDITFSDSEDD